MQPDALADATGAELHEVVAALERLREHHEFERPGLVLRDIGGSWPLSSHQDGEPSARRLLARPRIPALTPAGPCRDARDHRLSAAGVPGRRSPGSRGPNAESVAATLLERGLVEEAGRPQFGGVLYRSAKLFLKPFGLRSLDELPDLSAFDPLAGARGRAARAVVAAWRGARGGVTTGRRPRPRLECNPLCSV